MKWSVVQWSAVEWNRMEWSGMECREGVNWSGADGRVEE
jgi:hypothetical protein